ncbi:hypothetical protein PAPYR_7218 [Paratrimastix pyriformis]|uniref:Uncharacterized protein n=1 Tax=Paratrimastix pyriformis TaxID=342808 RepID=A0ABQ8UDE6_9EUKA|nr:hypothetical protein PAPYR_7218 [Paratrimastix pyriformis]
MMPKTRSFAQLEIEAARAVRLQPHVAEIIDFLLSRGVKLALITRNTRESVSFLLKKLHPLPSRLRCDCASCSGGSPVLQAPSAPPSPPNDDTFSFHPFDRILTREDEFVKPDSRVLTQCLLSGDNAGAAQSVLFVGDSLLDDVACGLDAGCVTVLFQPLTAGSPICRRGDTTKIHPHYVVHDLRGVRNIFEQYNTLAN